MGHWYHTTGNSIFEMLLNLFIYLFIQLTTHIFVLQALNTSGMTCITSHIWPGQHDKVHPWLAMPGVVCQVFFLSPMCLVPEWHKNLGRKLNKCKNGLGNQAFTLYKPKLFIVHVLCMFWDITYYWMRVTKPISHLKLRPDEILSEMEIYHIQMSKNHWPKE